MQKCIYTYPMAVFLGTPTWNPHLTAVKYAYYYIIREAFLHIHFALSYYSCTCDLPVNFNMSGQSPQTALINKVLLTQNCPLLHIFFCFVYRTIPCKL